MTDRRRSLEEAQLGTRVVLLLLALRRFLLWPGRQLHHLFPLVTDYEVAAKLAQGLTVARVPPLLN